MTSSDDGLGRLWAGWRSEYVADIAAATASDEGGTLFERLSSPEIDDEVSRIVWRGGLTFAVLNAYPYSTGHLMVVPYRPVADLDGLTLDETAELWQAVRSAVAALRSAYHPDGFNVGMNLGQAGGAGVPDHLHVHCLPRWSADTNFMTSVADTRVLPESLDSTWHRLREAWPT
jgi:ATP adenylyltransferase